MKKIIRDRWLIILIDFIIIGFINLFLIGIPLGVFLDVFNNDYILIVYLCLLLIINISLFIVFYKMLTKKLRADIYVTSDHIKFYFNREDYNVSTTLIEKLRYVDDCNGNSLLLIKYDGTTDRLNISKKDAFLMSKIINKPIEDATVKISKKFINWWKDLMVIISDNKYKILFTILGLIISIASFFLYINFKDQIWLCIILILTNLTYGILQLYFLYFNEKIYSEFNKWLFVILSTFFFILFIFLIITVISAYNQQGFSIDYLVYAIMLLPSFVIVLALIAIVIICLGYA